MRHYLWEATKNSAKSLCSSVQALTESETRIPHLAKVYPLFSLNMPKHSAIANKYISLSKRQCCYCNHVANSKGISSHERACKRKLEDNKETRVILESLHLERRVYRLFILSRLQQLTLQFSHCQYIGYATSTVIHR